VSNTKTLMSTHLSIRVSINVILFSYLTKLNRILNGKDLRYINQDHIFRLAFEKYLKTRKG
jgi:hypothetical protein